MPEIIYDHSQIDFSKPGKHHYQMVFHQDSSWGYSLVSLSVINGLRKSPPKARTSGVVAFGGTHGNEWEDKSPLSVLVWIWTRGGFRPGDIDPPAQRKRVRRQHPGLTLGWRQREQGVCGKPAGDNFLSHLKLCETRLLD